MAITLIDVVDADKLITEPDDLLGYTASQVKVILDKYPTELESQVNSSIAEINTALFTQGTKTYDPGSIADGAYLSTTVTVTGAVLGDVAVASFSLSTAGLVVTANVTSTDTVTVCFFNKTGSPIDLLSGTLKARLIK